MSLVAVTDLVRERIGLAPESLGQGVLPRAVAGRMQRLQLTNPVAYAARLSDDPLEFELLIADLLVPETWFFRGGELFTYLAGQIAQAVKSRPPGKRYRVLSVPCSSGEEPYSLAITLLETGVPSAAWSIEGVDLSPQQIERARQANYGEFSFRQTAPERRERYFRRRGDGWELTPAIRALVRFRQDNLLTPFFLAGEMPFDLIFCRNLFIYLHPAARQQALATLDRLLAPEGLLCMGHAEPLEFLDQRFVHSGPDGCFLYRRLVRAQDRPTTEPAPKKVEPAATPATPSAAVVDLLVAARQQADRGQLDDALALCRRHLAETGASAALYSLIGVLHQARGEKEEAVRCFQRALYLEPDHAEALTHLMLLVQERGDLAQAARLRRRLERATPGGKA